MRNHIFVLILLLLIGKVMNAQPTLAAYNSNPIASTQYTCIGVNYIAPINPSGFTTWVFTSLVSKDTFITSYYHHGEIPGDSLFPTSDITMKTKNLYKFLITSTQGVNLTGYSDSFIYTYSNTADLIRYPFTYTDQYTDNYTCKYIRKNDTINRTGTITVNAPAYGTIKLPYGNINNVLEVKVFEAFSDFTKTGNEYHEITTYSWHVPGLSPPILSFKSENFNGNYTESGFYLTKESLGVYDKKNVPFDVSLINHSEKSVPALHIIVPYSLTVNINCVNSTGQEMFVPLNRKLLEGENKVELPDQNLKPGLYLMIIRTGDNQVTKRFVIGK